MGAAAAGTVRARPTAWLRSGALTALVLGLDQGTKALVRGSLAPGEEHELLPFLSLVHVQNRGVAFGFLSGGGLPVTLIVGGALLLLVGFFARHAERALLWLPTGLLLGGAVGNLVDRLHQGHVTDFVKLPHWPAFNVADISITAGVIALVLVLERHGRAAAD